MKVCIWPTLSEIEPNNGIGRVVYAQYKGLPKYGIQLTTDPNSADLIVCHTQQAGLPRVDVLHCHGIYWTGDPGSGYYNRWHHRANAEVVSAARRARAVTVPSKWVAEPFKRDMNLSPTIIGHGIDPDEWTPGDPGGYVLWNKNRSGDVCDPTPAWKLAQANIPVMSTFLPNGAYPPAGMVVTGPLPHSDMQQKIRNASVYLATVKETFGIGTLEAMACGVPVLGFRWGGTADLVEHRVTGYLAEPGDLSDLIDGYHYIVENRNRLSKAAMEVARSYSWDAAIEKYAILYDGLMRTPESTGVTVVIPSYNYAPFVGQAIDSVLRQTYRPDEIIVIDDGSTDDTQEVLARYGDSIRVIKQENQGVAEARNNGIRASTQPFIVCLDADDMLDPRYLETCRTAMMSDRSLGVVYTGLSLMTPTGELRPNAWPPAFEWEHMTNVSVPPSSCIPIAAMFRKTMWERAGGFRQEYAPGEDTEFWVRGLATGFTAVQAWNEGLFWYRAHAGSASRTKVYKRIDGQMPWMRDKKYPMAAPANQVPMIRSYSQPCVSVIIPVGDGHEDILTEAIRSVVGQTVREWELIVIDDTKASSLYKGIEGYPFVRVYVNDGKGPGAARNLGLQHAKAPLVLFLDADDYLHPETLMEMTKVYAKAGGRYVYTDWVAMDGEDLTIQKVPDYNAISQLKAPQHGVTVLMDRGKAIDVRFDPKLPVLEDWDFFARSAILGYHGVRLPEPLLYVRVKRGTRTALTMKHKDKFLAELGSRYTEYLKGNLAMGSCCGGSGGAAVIAAKRAYGEMEQPMNMVPTSLPASEDGGLVRMEFVGERKGAVTYGGSKATPSGKQYRGGNNMFDKFVDVLPEDVEWMLRTTHWVVVPRTVQRTEMAPVLAEKPVVIDHVPAVSEAIEVQESVPVEQTPAWADEPIAAPEVELAAKEADGESVSGRKRRSKAKA